MEQLLLKNLNKLAQYVFYTTCFQVSDVEGQVKLDISYHKWVVQTDDFSDEEGIEESSTLEDKEFLLLKQLIVDFRNVGKNPSWFGLGNMETKSPQFSSVNWQAIGAKWLKIRTWVLDSLFLQVNFTPDCTISFIFRI